MFDPPIDNYRECGSCGGRGYVPDEPEHNHPDGSPRGRECRDCNGEGWVPVAPEPFGGVMATDD
jgi:DnaJ-class molecular chaperone